MQSSRYGAVRRDQSWLQLLAIVSMEDIALDVCTQAANEARPSVNTTTLCPECSGIDFVAVFEADHEYTILNSRSIRAAFESDCALCQLVFRSIANVLAEHYTIDQLLDPKRKIQYNLYAEHIPDDVNPPTSDFPDYYRIRINCISEIRFPHRNNPRSLDMIGQNFHQDPKRHRAERKVLRKTFNTTDLKTWLADCDQNHERKPPPPAYDSEAAFRQLISSNRFRLIDVRDSKIVVASEECRYFALSYVWGDTASYMERYCPYEAMASLATATPRNNDVWPVDWSCVPRTIRDAAALVEGLNERYIWVDTLCINQHDKDDKATLVASMDTIYQNAYLTIVAASGDNADAGLARFTPGNADNADYADEDTVTCRTSRGDITLVPSMPNVYRLLYQSKWASRGWTYQEFVLSRRAVCFTEHEVFFTCEQDVHREVYRPVHYDTKAASSQGFPRAESWSLVHELLMSGTEVGLNTYWFAVEEYTERQLSHVEDRLLAFAGILHRIEPLQSTEYLYTFNGLPSQWFYHALAWESYQNKSTAIANMLDDSNTHVSSSWSWAGWTGEVSKHRYLHTYNPLRVEALDQHNIVGSPVKEDVWWKHWPVVPTLCTDGTSGCTTLHRFAPLLRLTFVKEKKGRGGVFASDKTSGKGTTRLGYTLSWKDLLSSVNSRAADIIAIPRNWESTDGPVRLFGIIYERHGGFARRVGSLGFIWDYHGSLADLENYISREYIRLR